MSILRIFASVVAVASITETAVLKADAQEMRSGASNSPAGFYLTG
jgi:hypothetical protein